jgi:hypothetical protein
MSWADTCGVCGNDLFWWRSKVGNYLVCMRCAPDPVQALELLARRGPPGLIRRVQAWTQDMQDIFENIQGHP